MIQPWTAPVTPAQAALGAAIAGAVPRIDTARLRLRAPVLADFAVWRAIFCSDRARFMDGPYAEDAAWDQFCLYAASWMLRGHGAWAVEAERETAGFVLIGMEPGDRDHELGFFFLEAHEGKGLAAEAARAARDHAFAAMGLATLVSYTDPANARAGRLCARLGATPDPVALDGAQVWHHHRRAS